MNRCTRSTRARALLALIAGLLFLSFTAVAQGIRREAPTNVVLGRLALVTPPVIAIDGKPDRLSPGARIRDLNNMLVLSASLSGKEVPVVYRRDSSGLVHEVWLLTEAEYAKLHGTLPSSGNVGSQGVQQFLDMLALIFGARP